MKNFLLKLWYDYKYWRYEQRCIKYLGIRPKKMYVSKEAYDAIQKRLAEPPDPEEVERIRKLLNRKAPWD